MNRLKELRQDKKLTQQELADIAEVSKRTYIYWENGESQIKPDKAQKLADYFGVSVGYLLGYSDFENQFDAYQELRKIDKEDFTNGAKGKILSLVRQSDLDTIEKKYVIFDGYDPDYTPFIDLLHAIDTLKYAKESELLIWYALLDDSKKAIVMNLAYSLATENK